MRYGGRDEKRGCSYRWWGITLTVGRSVTHSEDIRARSLQTQGPSEEYRHPSYGESATSSRISFIWKVYILMCR